MVADYTSALKLLNTRRKTTVWKPKVRTIQHPLSCLFSLLLLHDNEACLGSVCSWSMKSKAPTNCPQVMLTSAAENSGIEGVWDTIEEFRTAMEVCTAKYISPCLQRRDAHVVHRHTHTCTITAQKCHLTLHLGCKHQTVPHCGNH